MKQSWSKASLEVKAQTRRAFTLVEMLVVIAIIGILTSLLLPALSSSKQKSGVAVCFNNQRQQGLAFAMYLQDNDDTYPVCLTWATCGGKTGRIAEHAGILEAKDRPLNKYVGNTDIFACPSDTGESGRSVIPETRRTISCFDAWGTSYCVAADRAMFRVKPVMGFKGSDPATALGPMKGSEVATSRPTRSFREIGTGSTGAIPPGIGPAVNINTRFCLAMDIAVDWICRTVKEVSAILPQIPSGDGGDL